jgi:pilus assembly protein TadC
VTGATWAAALLSGASVMVAGDAAHVSRSRVRRLSSSGSSPPGSTSSGSVPPGRAIAWSVAATALFLVAIRSLGRGPVLAAVAPMLFLAARRRWAAQSAERRQQREVAAALPRFADLVAACLESGATAADAIDVVRRHVKGPLAERLAPVVGALRSGVDPLTVYDSHGRDDPLRRLVVGLARAMQTGAPLADMVAAVADDQRRHRRWSAEAAARRAGVHAVGPLVLCFLPAFVLLGVVPVVLSIAVEVLGGLS